MLRYRLVALTASLAVSLLIVEGALRAMNLGLGSSPIESDPYLHHVHPRNYSFVQQHPSGELGGFTTHYDADRRVVGDRPAPRPIGGVPCRIAFMGDSFTEAGQVPYEASFVGILQQRAAERCDVRNYGVRSYSPAIYDVQWAREVSQWQPTHVFVLLFGNDVGDDRAYLESASPDSDGFPTAVRGPEGGWLTAQLRRLYIARYIRATTLKWQWRRDHEGQPIWTVGGQAEENPDWTDPSAKLVLELNRRVVSVGARFILMAVPSRYRLMGDGTVPVGELDFHEKIRRWAAAQGIQFLPLSPTFEAAGREARPYFLSDIHFNEAGHRLAADAITNALPELFGRH
ncbi:MAG TPA: SGNH/GDSL hydrolase family protein [Vicinamibacterales bacterium]